MRQKYASTDIKQLSAHRNRVLRWIETQGVVFCLDRIEKEKLRNYLLNVFLLFKTEFVEYGLCAIYVYRQEEQSAQNCKHDATCWKDVICNSTCILYAVGISTAALARGRNYTVLVFLHELTHMIHGGAHSSEFHRTLDSLLQRYNAYAGTNIQNDYMGLHKRFDSIPYDPLAQNVPQITLKSGTSFRTNGKPV